MARMHPEDIDDLENATVGEWKVYRFLQAVARPDSDFIKWYEASIGEQGGILVSFFSGTNMVS